MTDPALAEGPAIREAATVMLLRDTDDGPEVLLVRRNPRSEFVGGFYVFPGGALDPADLSIDAVSRCAGVSPAEADRRLGAGGRGLGHWVAGLRELFEEVGVLLALDADGERVRVDSPETVRRFAQHRSAVDSGGMTIADVCAVEDLWLDAGAMAYAAHWITPPGQPRRFDTRFFVAGAPEDQEALYDDREIVGQCWIAPGEALQRSEAGEMAMILPTLHNLKWLSGFDRARDAVVAAQEQADVPAVAPRQVGDRFVLGEGV